ncbi:MAG: S8 family serine peptidase [Elusimicrobia bacterium]|nr:S8 family serine peptidase [Elusimicrobiota bacterium]
MLARTIAVILCAAVLITAPGAADWAAAARIVRSAVANSGSVAQAVPRSMGKGLPLSAAAPGIARLSLPDMSGVLPSIAPVTPLIRDTAASAGVQAAPATARVRAAATLPAEAQPPAASAPDISALGALEAGAAQVAKADGPEPRDSALASLFTGSRLSPSSPAGESEVLVTLPETHAVARDIRAERLIEMGVDPEAVERRLYREAERSGITRGLIEEHGGRPTGSLRRLNTLIFKVPADKAADLTLRLKDLGYAARIGRVLKLKPAAGGDEKKFHQVSLSEMNSIIRADRLQAELKKVLGEPVSPARERFIQMTKPGLAVLRDWLKAKFRSIVLGVGVLNPALPWAVIDTCVMTTHAFLKDRFEKEVNNTLDEDIHGTHTAGTVVGVDIFNWRGRVYNILPAGRFNEGEGLMLINQAVNDGAIATTNSWGQYEGDPEAEETKLYQVTAGEGIHHNISAGNSGELGSDSIGAPAIAYYFTRLIVNGLPVGRAKRIKAVANADYQMKTAESSSRGPGSVATAENFEEYRDYPSKPDEAGIGMHLVAPTFGPGEHVRFDPELGGLVRPLSGTSMAAPGTFGGFLLLTRGILVLLKDYLPNLPGKELTLYAMDLARYAMTKTGRKVAPVIEQGDGFVDVWAAFEYSAGLLKASTTRLLPRVRELFRRAAGLGGYGDHLAARLKAELSDPANADKGEEPGPKPPFAIQRPVQKFKQPAAIQATLLGSDGRHGFVTLADGSVRKIDLATGAQLWAFNAGMGTVNQLLLAADGKHLFAAGDDNFIRTLDMDTGAEVRRFRGNWRRGVKAVRQSKDGRRLFAACGDTNVYMIDARTGEEARRFVGHKDFAFSLALSDDGRYLFSGGADRFARQWDVETGREVRSFPVKDDWVFSLAVTKDGRHLFTGSNGTKLWDIATGELLAELKWKTDWVHSLTLTADSKYLFAALSGKSLVMWDISSRGKVALFKGHKSNVISLALSADERRLISGGDDPNLLIWDVPDRSELPVPVEDSIEAPPEDAAGMPGRDPDKGKGKNKNPVKASAARLETARPPASTAPPIEEILAGNDVLLLGENHASLSSVRWITENIPRLKAAGVTHIGIESLEIPEEGAVRRTSRSWSGPERSPRSRRD